MRLLRLILLMLLPTIVVAQSVPNGPITQGEIWTPAQWNAAWASKFDLSLNAPGTVVGVPNVSIASVAIAGTAGQITFVATGTVVAGQRVTIAGTYGGTGSIVGYVNPTTYVVGVTNGSSTATLTAVGGAALVTTAGTPSGLTYSFTAAPGALTALPGSVAIPNQALNLQQLGACGITDSTTIFNAATALATTTGQPLYIPGGCTINHTGTLTLTALTLIGDGITSILNATNQNPVGVSITAVSITGTAGQFSCTCTNLTVAQIVTVSGSLTGTGTITGYADSTNYYISATDGTSTFTLQDTTLAPIVTSAGSTTGLTFTAAPNLALRVGGAGAVVRGINFKTTNTAARSPATNASAILAGAGLTNCSIDHNYFTSQFAATDIQFAASGTFCEIAFNQITVGPLSNPMIFQAWGGLGTAPYNINIHDNYVQAGGVGDTCVELTYAVTYINVEHNQFSGCGAHGISVIGGQHINIIGNQIQNVVKRSIDLEAAAGFTLAAISDINIIGNNIQGQATASGTSQEIFINGSSTFPVKDVNVLSNVLTVPSGGTNSPNITVGSCSGCSSATIANTRINVSKNIIDGGGSTQTNTAAGIAINGVFDLTIEGNDITAIPQQGIQTNGTSNDGGQLKINGNHFSNLSLKTTGASPAINLGTSGFSNIEVVNNSYSAGANSVSHLITCVASTPSVLTSGNIGSDTSVSGCTLTSTGTSSLLAQSGLPFILPPSAFFANNGVFVIGQAPSTSATLSVSGTSGSVTATFSAATLLGTAADVGRVVTILDTTYKYCTITTQSSTTVATCTVSGGTLSGTGPFANASLWLSGSPTTNTTAFSVPLDAVYTNAFMWAPTGAIASASAAGWYFCQLASTTQGTCFNNTYVSGQPQIPASPTAFSTTGPGAFTQTINSPITAVVIGLSGNALGVNGDLDVRVAQTANNSAGTKNFQITYGSGGAASVNGTTTTAALLETFIDNAGVANVQTASAAFGTVIHHLTVDSTSAQNVDLKEEIITAATDWSILQSFSMRVLQTTP